MDQHLDIFGLNKGANSVIELQNGKLQFFENFFDKNESDKLFYALINTIHWHKDKMAILGKEVNLPRLSAWYGDEQKAYKYSGISLSPLPWSAVLLDIKNKIDQVSGVKFNSVLLNRYRDGNDSISWHSDDESELGQNPVIGSVNFGETRRFMLKHKFNKSLKYEVLLKHGSFLLMSGELQHYWLHQIPKTSQKIGERINLTFRIINSK
jgi:alkylated DNA repair dioxygenase AlkB